MTSPTGQIGRFRMSDGAGRHDHSGRREPAQDDYSADELTQSRLTTYSYDQNGNQTAAGSATMTYDLANRLKTHAAGNTTTTYSYDGDGVRLQASTGNQAAKKTNFVWDRNHDLPRLALERDGNNALLRRYVYGKRRISMTTSGAASYYHYDNLGSVANLTSAAGATQWTWAYEPFGTVRTETKASGTQPTNLLRFTGEYHDPTGLYHLRARQYAASNGRFLQGDPAMQMHDRPRVSLYAYADNRPTSLVDRSGATPTPPDDAQSGAAYATSASLRAFCLSSAPTTVDARPSGCGPPSFAWAIPEYRFSSACNGHDRCYATWGRRRRTCDHEFLVAMNRICTEYSRQGVTLQRIMNRWIACSRTANIYYRSVREVARPAFEKSQMASCPRKETDPAWCERQIDARAE